MFFAALVCAHLLITPALIALESGGRGAGEYAGHEHSGHDSDAGAPKGHRDRSESPFGNFSHTSHTGFCQLCDGIVANLTPPPALAPRTRPQSAAPTPLTEAASAVAFSFSWQSRAPPRA